MNKKKRVISVTAVILAIAAVITYINFPKKDKTVSAVQSVDELYEKIVYKKSESNYDAYLKDNSTLEAIKEKILNTRLTNIEEIIKCCDEAFELAREEDCHELLGFIYFYKGEALSLIHI